MIYKATQLAHSRCCNVCRTAPGKFGDYSSSLHSYLSAARFVDLAGPCTTRRPLIHGSQTQKRRSCRHCKLSITLYRIYTKCTATTVEALHDEAYNSRQDDPGFQKKVFPELTNSPNRVDSSPRSLMSAIGLSQMIRAAGWVNWNVTCNLLTRTISAKELWRL